MFSGLGLLFGRRARLRPVCLAILRWRDVPVSWPTKGFAVQRPPTAMSRVVACRKDIVVLHIGGNDICDRAASPPIMVALDVLRLARRLLDVGTRRVDVCQVCRRSRWRGLSYEDGAARVIEINRYLEAFCRDSDGVFFWRYKRVWNSVHEVFRADGVHFNDVRTLTLRQASGLL